jgi:hypothetical protein
MGGNKTACIDLFIYMTELEVVSPPHTAPSDPAGGGAVTTAMGGSGAPGSCRPAARARARIEAVKSNDSMENKNSNAYILILHGVLLLTASTWSLDRLKCTGRTASLVESSKTYYGVLNNSKTDIYSYPPSTCFVRNSVYFFSDIPQGRIFPFDR